MFIIIEGEFVFGKEFSQPPFSTIRKVNLGWFGRSLEEENFE